MNRLFSAAPKFIGLCAQPEPASAKKRRGRFALPVLAAIAVVTISTTLTQTLKVVDADQTSVVGVSAGILDFTAGSGQANNVNVTLSGSTYTITDSAGSLTATTGCTYVSGTQIDCSATGVTSLRLNGADGNDTLKNSTATASTLNGDDGNDAVIGGTGIDTLNGGNNDDTLDGNTGADPLNGGSGTDTVTYASRSAAVTATIDASANDGVASENDKVATDVENLIGGTGNDSFTGNGSSNTFTGGPGDDTLDGAGGYDTNDYSTATSAVSVDMATTSAQATGGAGSDTLSSLEHLTGSEYGDTLVGNSGINNIRGLGGNDTLDGAAGNDDFSGGSGSDTVTYASQTTAVTVSLDDVNNDGVSGETDNVHSAVENITTGSGNDTLIGSASANALNGGDGTDMVSFAGAASAVVANLTAGTATGQGSDTLSNAEGLTGSAANDTLIGSAGDNILDGSGGTDTVDYTPAASGVTVNLATTSSQATGGAGSDTLSNFESLTGSEYGDTLTGSTAVNIMRGLAGNDTIDGGTGGDDFSGGDGTDTVTYVVRTAAVTASIDELSNDGVSGEADNIHSGVENITSGSGNDTLSGSGAANALNGGDGTDMVSFGGSASPVTASLTTGTATGQGSDTLSNVEGLTGSTGNDTLIGNAGDNILDGSGGTDTVDYSTAAGGVNVNIATSTAQATGGAGSDTLSNIENLTGSDFGDTLAGSSVENIMRGLAGDDTIDGASGGDDFSGGDGTDTVTYASRTTAVTASLDDLSNDGVSGEADNIHTGVENVTTGSGNDTLSGFTTANVLDGGSGTDVVTFAGSGSPIDADLAAGTATGQGADTLSNIEGLTGSAYDDTLTGSAIDNAVRGGNGDDVIDGGTGADALSGGDGTDTVTYATRTATVTATIDGAANDGADSESDNVATDVENLEGGSGADSLTGNSATNSLFGGAGDDLLDVFDTQAEEPSCGEGDDVVVVDESDTVGDDCEGRELHLETKITSGPENGAETTESEISYAFSSRHGTGFECSWDNEAFEECSSPETAEALSLGYHYFQVRSTDSSGVDPSPAERAVSVTAPLRPDVTDGVMTVESPAGLANDLRVRYISSGNEYEIVDQNRQVVPGDGCYVGAGETVRCAALAIDAIQVLLGDEDDKLQFDSPSDPVEIDLGDGDDVFEGTDGETIVHGGEGDDQLNLGSGSDEAFGDSGDDLVRSVDGNIESIDCGSGIDQAITDNSDDTTACEALTDPTEVEIDTSGAEPMLNIVSTSERGVQFSVDSDVTHASISIVSSGDEMLAPGDGCVSIAPIELSCDATGVTKASIATGAGADEISLNLENDITASLDTGEGDDIVTGGEEDDLLLASPGDDTFKGGGGIDTFDASERTENLRYAMNDIADDGAVGESDDIRMDVETTVGGSGDDQLIAGFQPTRLEGGDGDDQLQGGPSDDELLGNAGSDTIDGRGGADRMDPGFDLLDEDTDSVSYATSGIAPVTIYLDAGAEMPSGTYDGTELDRIESGFDRAVGGSDDDVIFGADVDEQLDPGAGYDIVHSGGGDDSIDVADGYVDEVTCGDGDDNVLGDFIDSIDSTCEGENVAASANITAGPAPGSAVNTSVVTFEFDVEGVSRAECSIEGGDWTPCVSPVEMDALVDGDHEFAVRAPGADEAVAGTVDSRSFEVDTVTPSLEISARPVGSTGVQEPVFDFSSEDESVMFECALDEGEAEPCASPLTLPELQFGSHTFVISASDAAGNTSSEATDFDVVVGSATVYLDDGQLSVNLGETVGNSVSIERSRESIRLKFTDGDFVPGFGCRATGTSDVKCSSALVESLVVTGGDNDDQVAVSPRVKLPVTMNGGGGADRMVGGSGHDHLDGGLGEDELDGGAGVDNLLGGDGDDLVRTADGLPDEIDCGPGTDTGVSDAADSDSNCEIGETKAVAASTETAGSEAPLEFRYLAAGGASSDLEIAASSRRAQFVDSAEEILAGAGCDQINPHTVKCTSAGAQAIAANLGDNDDKLQLVETSALTTTASGGSGEDTLIGGASSDVLFGDSGDDELRSAPGDSDILDGGDGHDVLAGNETVADQLLGGEGTDAVSYATRADNVVLALGTESYENGSAGEGDYLSSIENAETGSGSDSITGSDGPNEIEPGTGEDEVLGADGADTIHTRDGSYDVVDCGDGTDVAIRDSFDSIDDSCESADADPYFDFMYGPTGPIGESTAEIAFGYHGEATYECDLDSGGFDECESPVLLSGLNEGGHLFRVRAVDGLGAVVAGPIEREFEVDLEAPDLVTDGPVDLDVLTDRAPTITLSSNDSSASFECALDSAAFTSCAATYTPNLSVGDHRVRIRAIDAAGNRSAIERLRLTVVPSSGIRWLDGPTDQEVVSEASTEYEFESESPGSTTECALDGGEFTSCESPFELSSGFSGMRTLAVRPVSATGERGVTSYRSVVFANGEGFEDTVAPQTLLLSAPSERTPLSVAPEFEFGSNEPTTFLCRLDRSDWNECESPWAPDVEGEHDYEISSVDLAGNFTSSTLAGSFDYQPGFVPESVSTAVDIATNSFPEILAPVAGIETNEETFAPALSTSVDETETGYEATGTPVSSVINRDSSAVGVETPVGYVSLVPVDAGQNASDATSVNGVGGVTGALDESSDVFAKPTLSGAQIDLIVRENPEDREYAWSVNLGPGKFLQLLPNGSVVARTDSNDADGESAVEGGPDPDEVDGYGSPEYRAAVEAIDRAERATGNSALLLLNPPKAVDALGQMVESKFEVDAARSIVKLVVNPSASAVAAPVNTRFELGSGLVAQIPAVRTPPTVFGISAQPTWPLFEEPFKSSTSKLRLHMASELGSGKTTASKNRKNVFRILVPWNAFSSSISCTGAGINDEAAPTEPDCIDRWLALRKIRGAYQRGYRNFYVSPERDYDGVNCPATSSEYVTSARYAEPCYLYDPEAFITNFSALYVALQSAAAGEGAVIRYWSAINEPDLTGKVKELEVKQVGQGYPANAAFTWRDVQTTLRQHGCGSFSTECVAFAGEFRSTRKVKVPKETPQDEDKRVVPAYLTAYVNAARAIGMQKDRFGRQFGEPRAWSIHNYRDVMATGTRHYGELSVSDIAKDGKDHGTAPFQNMMDAQALLRKVSTPEIWVTETGVDLDTPSSQASQGGNGVNYWGDSTRDIGIPLAANRLKFLIRAGRGDFKSYMGKMDSARKGGALSNVQGVIAYQMAVGDRNSFDSSFYEAYEQRCTYRPRPGCDPTTSKPLPRPFLCAMMSRATKDEKQPCGGNNEPTYPNASVSFDGEEQNFSVTPNNPSNTDVSASWVRPLIGLDNRYVYEAEFKLKICVYSSDDTEISCYFPDHCKLTGCGPTGTLDQNLLFLSKVGNPPTSWVPLILKTRFSVYTYHSCGVGGGYKYTVAPILTVTRLGARTSGEPDESRFGRELGLDRRSVEGPSRGLAIPQGACG